MRRHTTTDSPLSVARSPGGAVADENAVSFYATNGWYGMNLYFEAKGGQPFTEQGIDGANIFTAQSMRHIKRFERLVREVRDAYVTVEGDAI